jgi:hypothetical protein
MDRGATWTGGPISFKLIQKSTSKVIFKFGFCSDDKNIIGISGM